MSVLRLNIIGIISACRVRNSTLFGLSPRVGAASLHYLKYLYMSGAHVHIIRFISAFFLLSPHLLDYLNMSVQRLHIIWFISTCWVFISPSLELSLHVGCATLHYSDYLHVLVLHPHIIRIISTCRCRISTLFGLSPQVGFASPHH